jgi:hypothetical protein
VLSSASLSYLPCDDNDTSHVNKEEKQVEDAKDKQGDLIKVRVKS